MKKKLLLLFVSFITLASCQIKESISNTSELLSHEYIEVESLHIEFAYCLNMPEQYYLIYFYQVSCLHCLDLKNSIIDYALNGNNKIYFINVDFQFDLFNSAEDTIGSVDPYCAFTGVTPQLSLVVQNEVYQTHVGNEDIKLYINM